VVGQKRARSRGQRARKVRTVKREKKSDQTGTPAIKLALGAGPRASCIDQGELKFNMQRAPKKKKKLQFLGGEGGGHLDMKTQRMTKSAESTQEGKK